MSTETKPTGRGRNKNNGNTSKKTVEVPTEPKEDVKVEIPVTDTKKVTEPKTKELKEIDLSKSNIATVDVNSILYINKIVKEATKVEDIFDNLLKSGPVSSVVNKLKTYRERMTLKHTEIDGVNQQYFMYNTIMEILNEKNYGLFSVKFMLLNKIFTLGKKEVFSGVLLSRYDYHWRWGVKTHDTYFKLVSIITTLADGRTRDKDIKTIDFNNGINNLGSVAKQNLIRYYK